MSFMRKIMCPCSSVKGAVGISSMEECSEIACIVHPGYIANMEKEDYEILKKPEAQEKFGSYSEYMENLPRKVDELRKEIPIVFYLPRNWDGYGKKLIEPTDEDYTVFTHLKNGIPFFPERNELLKTMEIKGVERVKLIGESTVYMRGMHEIWIGCARHVCDDLLASGFSVEPLLDCVFPQKPMFERDPFYKKTVLSGISDMTLERQEMMSEKQFDRY